MEKSGDFDIHQLMSLTQDYVAKLTSAGNKKQSAPYESLLSKRLFFNPGFKI